MSTSELLEGEVRSVRHPDGRVELTAVPRVARVSLARLADSSVEASGNRIIFAGRAAYRVRAWDHQSHALICDLQEDRGSSWVH